MTPEELLKQQEKDKEELAALPKSVNKPISWCSQHNCKMTTCFSIHNPASVTESTVKTEPSDIKIFRKRIEELEEALDEAKEVSIYWQKQYSHLETEMADLDTKGD